MGYSRVLVSTIYQKNIYKQNNSHAFVSLHQLFAILKVRFAKSQHLGSNEYVHATVRIPNSETEPSEQERGLSGALTPDPTSWSWDGDQGWRGGWV